MKITKKQLEKVLTESISKVFEGKKRKENKLKPGLLVMWRVGAQKIGIVLEPASYDFKIQNPKYGASLIYWFEAKKKSYVPVKYLKVVRIEELAETKLNDKAKRNK